MKLFTLLSLISTCKGTKIMTLVFFTFGAMLLMILIMSVGVLFKRAPIKGTCGGLANLAEGESCAICGVTKSEQANQKSAQLGTKVS